MAQLELDWLLKASRGLGWRHPSGHCAHQHPAQKALQRSGVLLGGSLLGTAAFPSPPPQVPEQDAAGCRVSGFPGPTDRHALPESQESHAEQNSPARDLDRMYLLFPPLSTSLHRGDRLPIACLLVPMLSPTSLGPWRRDPCLYLVPSSGSASVQSAVVETRHCPGCTLVLTWALLEAVQAFPSSRNKFKGSGLKGKEGPPGQGRKKGRRATGKNKKQKQKSGKMRWRTWRPSLSPSIEIVCQ